MLKAAIAGASCANFSSWGGQHFSSFMGCFFHLRYFQCAHCDRPEQRATASFGVRWSLGNGGKAGGRFGSWSVLLSSVEVDGGYNHCAVDGSLGGTDG